MLWASIFQCKAKTSLLQHYLAICCFSAQLIWCRMLFRNTTSSTPRYECIQHWELIKINPLSCGYVLGCRKLRCFMWRNHLHVSSKLQKWSRMQKSMLSYVQKSFTRTLSVAEMRWGEEKNPVLRPYWRSMDSVNAQVEPLPLVPLTWMIGNESWNEQDRNFKNNTQDC